MATVSVAWLFTVPRRHAEDWTPYHNDAIALNECAARLLMSGVDPYAALDIFDCYGRLGIGPDRTPPLRQGLFADVSAYPTAVQLVAAWPSRSRAAGKVAFLPRSP